MHYSISYDGDEAKALTDAKDWLGEDRWKIICEYSKEHNDITLDKLRLILSFAGLQGFPVLAIHKHFWPDVPHTEANYD